MWAEFAAVLIGFVLGFPTGWRAGGFARQRVDERK
jgi:hypothetical protein